jgi:nickel/cobalt exporter
MDVYLSMAVAGLSVSFFHAILPNHWLPFVFAGRAQRWSMRKTLSITTLAGGGHIFITTLLGVLIVWMGLKLSAYVEALSVPLAAGTLILFGLYYIVRHLRGEGHDHSHGHNRGHDHNQGESNSAFDRSSSSDTVAVGSLIAMLTFSPCKGFLAIYLMAWPYGWMAFILLSAVLAAGTLSGMLIFTGLTYAGLQRVEMPWLEHHEYLILGSILILLGIAVIGFHL